MTQRRKRLLIALVIASAVIGAIVMGARTLLPSWLRGTVERMASEGLGRDVKITGPFDVAFSLTPTVTAGDVTLANAPWGSEPFMLRAGRMTIVLDLVSLWSGPVRIREFAIEDARLLLEANDEGHGNWRFAREPNRPPPIRFDHLAIRQLEVIYPARPEAPPGTLVVRELAARLDPASRMIDLQADGRFGETPWEVSGRLGTLEQLYDGQDIDHELTGRIGQSNFDIRGRIRDPLELGEPRLEVRLDGPDIAAALAHLGLRSPLTGAYQARGRFTPATDGVEVDVQAAVDGVTAGVRGVVNALLDLDRFDLEVEAAGPDAARVGPWIGVRGLPPRPFDLAGRVRREDGRLFVEAGTIRVGPTSLSVAGELGAPPLWVGTDLAVRAAGQDLSELSALTRLRLPPGPFEIGGRFLRREDGLAIEAAELRSGAARVRADGTIGEPPRLSNLDLTVEAAGPDLARFSRVATVDLPQRPFDLCGRLARDGPVLVLDAVEGRLGDDTVTVSGRVVPSTRLLGTDVEVRVAGPDLATFAALATLHGFPAEPFDVAGRVRVEPDGYGLERVAGFVGRVGVAVEGRIGSPSALDATSLWGRAEGLALSDLVAWGLPGPLPADPFSIAGRIQIASGVYRADRVELDVGPDHAVVDGVLGALPDLALFDSGIDAAGPSLADLGRFFAVAGVEAPRRLPAEAYAVSGRLRRLPSGIELREVHGTAGATTFRVNGTVGSASEPRGTDLRFEVQAPDTSQVAMLSAAAFPVGPFEAHGRIARLDAGLLCDRVAVAIGDARAEVSGTLGPSPEFEGSDLRIAASVPDLRATFGSIAGFPKLPAEAFEVTAEIEGSLERFTTTRFTARLGESDLGGRISVRAEGKAVVDADLRAERADLSGLVAGFIEQPEVVTAPPVTGRGSPRGGRVLSDESLTFDFFRSLDATVRLEAAELTIADLPLRDAIVAGELIDGALRLDRVEGTGPGGGRASGSLSIEPVGDGYRLRSVGRVDGGRLAVPAAGQAHPSLPSVDMEFELQGEGRSLRDIAAHSDGRVLIVVGSGELPYTVFDSVKAPALRLLLETFNPFRKLADHTDVECGIALAHIKAGKTIIDPIAARTANLTLVGRGKIDLATEAIDLVLAVKSRKGIGISTESVTNDFVKLGGTLAAPRLDAKPLKAAASTGAAVASAGLSIVFRGIYDRITAEKRVCVNALDKARKQLEAEAPDAGP